MVDYDQDGMPTNAQATMVVNREIQTVSLPWRSGLDAKKKEEAAQKIEIWTAMWRAYTQSMDAHPSTPDAFVVLGKEDGKGNTEVKTKREFKKGEVLLIPLPGTLNHIVKMKANDTKDPNPKAVPCGSFFLLPGIVRKKDSASFVPPFWCARRSSVESECNVHLVKVDVSTTTVMLSASDSILDAKWNADVAKVQIPVFTNQEKIQNDQEIVVYMKKPCAPNNEKTITFLEQAKKKAAAASKSTK